MFKSNLSLAGLAAIGTLFLGGGNAYAEEAPKPTDLKSYACKDIMRLSGTERDISLALAHGYVLGKKNQTQFVTEELAAISDNFVEYCLDHPTENALQAFEKLAK